MNGTRYHVYAGLAGPYLVRDRREAELGLPVEVADGEITLVMADRNVDVAAGGSVRLLHKTTQDTAESFGPLTVVGGRIWPRLPLRPEVYRLRLLNGSNARAYRLHLVAVGPRADGTASVTPVHERLLVIGTDGGLLWRAAPVPAGRGITLAPAERIDVLVDLAGLPEGARLHLINSAPAPFGGQPEPTPQELEQLWAAGAPAGLNPYPWVMRIDVTADAPTAGRPHALFESIAAAELNPAFRRLVPPAGAPAAGAPAPGGPQHLPVTGHEHRVVLLGETDPPGHLYLQELLEDPDGEIAVQLRPADPGPTRFRVQGWMTGDTTPSSQRVSFYDAVGLRPQLGRWQVWMFVNSTGDTHPIHIHQSTFQPLGDAGVRLVFDDAIDAEGNRKNRYDPETRTTSQPLLADPATPPRAYDPQETTGWKDVIRVDPGTIVSVAIRFDVPGRYVYHCHVLEHEDTEMMRPLVVTVLPMADGGGSMPM
jgi:spore coat protein A